MLKTHLVSGKLKWCDPRVGEYRVFSRSRYTNSIQNPAVKWGYMIRFTKGCEGGNIGFHEIPKKYGVPLQSIWQLGTPLSAGCVRQATRDASGCGTGPGSAPRSSSFPDPPLLRIPQDRPPRRLSVRIRLAIVSSVMAAENTHDDERPPLRRTWPQRLLIAGVACAAGGSLDRRRARLVRPAATRGSPTRRPRSAHRRRTGRGSRRVGVVGRSDGAADGPSADDVRAGRSRVDPNVPVETFPPAEPGARNILITGADNNACLDPDSPYAPAFGDREGLGERSDTIMMWRVNPATNQVAVLSFPRDLWLKIDGRSSKGRINEAYERDDPQRLINTIRQNFGIETDHFVQVDFCAFKELVDAVDGVAVPFETPVRDGATGLVVLGARVLHVQRRTRPRLRAVAQDGVPDRGRPLGT